MKERWFCSRAPRPTISTSIMERIPYVTSSNPVAGGGLRRHRVGPYAD